MSYIYITHSLCTLLIFIHISFAQVDNVPLLVSLYTDSTPATVNEMIGVFQEYGEVSRN